MGDFDHERRGAILMKGQKTGRLTPPHPSGVRGRAGNSLDKLHHARSVAYSVELVLPNKQQICVAELLCAVARLPNGYHEFKYTGWPLLT